MKLQRVQVVKMHEFKYLGSAMHAEQWTAHNVRSDLWPAMMYGLETVLLTK